MDPKERMKEKKVKKKINKKTNEQNPNDKQINKQVLEWMCKWEKTKCILNEQKQINNILTNKFMNEWINEI